jgi:multiple sugar transport system ATP-binding protein
MTMGDRVAVIKKGQLQQVDAPQTLYDLPVNLFVAGFIGSPAMNMVEATVEREGGGVFLRFGSHRLRVDDQRLRERPEVERFDGRSIVVGIRPEDIADAKLASFPSSDGHLPVTVDLRESLGSTVMAHFTIDAPMVLTEDTKELAHDVGAEALDTLQRRAAEAASTFVAQLDPRTEVRARQTAELVVNTARLHFFDPETGLALDGAPRGS